MCDDVPDTLETDENSNSFAILEAKTAISVDIQQMSHEMVGQEVELRRVGTKLMPYCLPWLWIQ